MIAASHRKILALFVVTAATAVVTQRPAFAHPGGLDQDGGHHNRKTGEYHYHQRRTPPAKTESKKPEPKQEREPPVQERPKVVIEAPAIPVRTQARTSARVEFRTNATLGIASLGTTPHGVSLPIPAEKPEPYTLPPKPEMILEPVFPKFVMILKYGSRRSLLRYHQTNDMYHVVFPDEKERGYPKSMVEAILPLDDPSKPRTWNDETGNYNIEATLVDYQLGKVRLRKTNGEVVTVPMSKLSKEDQYYAMDVSRRS